MQKRRNFLKNSLLLLGASTAAIKPLEMVAAESKSIRAKELLKFGVFADLHHDLIKDGTQRVAAFIAEMKQVQPDFILQMGDFCTPKSANKAIMEVFNSFEGAKHHVIGNHDTDGGFTHDQVVDFWNAKGKYYSFDLHNYHFIILNGNERPPNDTTKGYPRSISNEQYNWLQRDLDSTKLPVIVFCHQGIDNDLDGLKEGNILRILFERTNQKAGFQKVKAVFSGHHHEDYHNVYNGINYIQINSIAYQFGRTKDSYEYAHTKEPIWALVSLYSNGTIKIKGKSSSYVNGTANYSESAYNGYPTVPKISDRTIS